MKAAVLVGDGDVRLLDVEEPSPAPDECLIKIRATGVCSSDIARAHGGGAYFYPLVMGHEIAGEVAAVGSEVGGFVVGQRVGIFPLVPCQQCPACKQKRFSLCSAYSYYGSRSHGGFAEYLSVKAWNLVPLPDKVSFSEAALLEPVSVVVHALRKAGLIDVERQTQGSLAILGAGFLGGVAVDLIQHFHPRIEVTVVDRNPAKLALLEGITTYCAKEKKDLLKFSEEHSNKFGTVLEAIGAPESYKAALEIASPNGRVVWMGNLSGELSLTQKQASAILRKELCVLGTWNSDYKNDPLSDWDIALERMAAGANFSRWVTQRISLGELPDTLRRLYLHKIGQAPFPTTKVLVTDLN